MNIKVRCDDDISVHVMGSVTDHLTECGIDGFDGYLGQENLGLTTDKIDCPQCIQMWRNFRKIKPSEIES